jgi:hypothetical protein
MEPQHLRVIIDQLKITNIWWGGGGGGGAHKKGMTWHKSWLLECAFKQ